MVLWAFGKKEAAVEDFRLATDLDPQNVAALKNLGRAYLSQGLADEAIRLLVKAQQLSPKDSDISLALGDSWSEKKKFDKALNFYKKALDSETSPEKKCRILSRTGLALEQSGNVQKALQTYSTALGATEDPSIRDGLTRKIEALRAQRKR